jgi:hypothetical protein
VAPSVGAVVLVRPGAKRGWAGALASLWPGARRYRVFPILLPKWVRAWGNTCHGSSE